MVDISYRLVHLLQHSTIHTPYNALSAACWISPRNLRPELVTIAWANVTISNLLDCDLPTAILRTLLIKAMKVMRRDLTG